MYRKTNSKQIDYANSTYEKTIDSNELTDSLQKNRSNSFTNIRIEGTISLSINSNNQSLTFKNCHFESQVYIHSVIDSILCFDHCTFNDEVIFGGKEYSTIFFIGFKGRQISFYGGNLKEVKINIIKLEYLNIWGGVFENFELSVNTNYNNSEINLEELSINPSPSLKIGNVNIVSGIIDKIVFLEGVLIDSSLYFSNIKTNKVIFNSFVNKSTIKFKQIIPFNSDPYIQITDSDLENVYFIGVKLDEYIIKIENSNIVSIKSINSSWPKEIFSISANLEIEKENYRQLKVAMRNNGNSIKALEYEKDELNLHYKTLKWSPDFVNKFILWTNWTNNQGHSWVRPFILLLLSTLIAYSSIKCCLGYTQFDLNYCKADIANFLRIMNPAHLYKFDDLDIQSNSTSYLVDSLYRIVSGYLLFQFFMAFRKFFNRK